jgi:hypothetical protein
MMTEIIVGGLTVIGALVGVVYARIGRDLRELKIAAEHHQNALMLICDKLDIKLGG